MSYAPNLYPFLSPKHLIFEDMLMSDRYRHIDELISLLYRSVE